MVSCQVTLSKIVQANILSSAHATIDRFRKCCKGTVHGLTTMYFWCGPSPPWKATSFICSHPALHCSQCLLIKWEGPGIFLHMRMTLSENGNNLQNEQALFHRPSYLSTSPIHTHTPSPTHHHQAQWVTTWLMQLWILNRVQNTNVTNLATSAPLLARYVFTVVRFTVEFVIIRTKQIFAVRID